MTRKNTNLSFEKKAEPFLLKPAGKGYLWGGSRLKEDFGKEIELEPLAETWECSTHPDGPSIVASGKEKGRLLSDVLKKHPEYLGTHPRTFGELPILIKFIDAYQDLSIQVHPDDAYARVYENGSLGKTEMWYVLDAKRDSRIIYGFHHNIDKNTLKRSLKEGTVEKYLQKVRVQKDDVFLVEPGTVHGIGAGVLLAEIQESSNITYRLYDYKRLDQKGKPRALHIEQALAVSDLKAREEPRQPMRVLRYQPGCAWELLCRCQYFQVVRLLINTQCCRSMVDYQTGSNTFEVLLCTDGCGVLFMGQEKGLNFFKGDCIFVPARSAPMKLHGKAQMLKVSC